jgi:hypothetical protein
LKPFVDTRAAELLFRQKVIAFLAGEDLLDEDRIELLDSWKSGYTGFSAHNAVTVPADDRTGLERLARYLLRPPVSLERLRRGWAQLIRRVYEADPLLCKCGEKMRILSFITDPPVVTKILEHLRRTRRDPSRAPPSATDAPVALAS